MSVRFFQHISDSLKRTFLRRDTTSLRLCFLILVWLSVLALMPTLTATAYPARTAQSVVDVHGSAADLLAQGRGRVQVFVFVRTDCPISNRYAPQLQRLAKKYGSSVTFRLVFPDKTESPEKIRSYLQEYGYELTAIRDLDHALVRKATAKVTPEAAVFDARGELAYHGRIDNLYEHIGQSRHAATTHELADAIEAASKGLSPATPTADAVGCFISDLE